MTYLLFAVGFLFLLRGATLLVEGSASLAKRFGLSTLVIGLTIVAMGTSAPEFFVNITSNITGAPAIGVGNIFGANVANSLLTLGVAALIQPLLIRKGVIWRDIPFALLATFIAGILANDALVTGAAGSSLDRSDGVVLVTFFAIFLYYTLSIARDGVSHVKKYVPEMKLREALFVIVLGITLLAVGANWIVKGAVAIAEALGVSATAIGLSLIALGTTLPELTTSAIAARRGETGIAVGNVVGSSIFNIFWILGISAIARPLPFEASANRGVLMGIIANALIFASLFIGKRHVIERWQGGALVALYLLYLAGIFALESL